MNVGTLEIEMIAGLARLQKDMEQANKVVASSMGSIEKSAKSAMNAISLVGAGFLVKEAIAMTDAYTKMNAQLNFATDSNREFAVAQEEVKRISKLAQSEIGTTATFYQRLALAVKDLGGSQKEIVGITETVAVALKASGAGARETSSTLLQLSQAFGSGRLAGEEFRSMSESAPVLMRALAKSMKVATGDMKDLAAQGKVTSAQMTKAFTDPALLESLRKQAEEMQTISGAWTVLTNELTLFVGESSKSSGAVSAISGSILLLSANISALATALELAAAVMAARFTASLAMAAKEAVTKAAAARALAIAENAAAAADLGKAKTAHALGIAEIEGTRATLAAIAAEKQLEAVRITAQITDKGRMLSIARMTELQLAQAGITRQLAAQEIAHANSVAVASLASNKLAASAAGVSIAVRASATAMGVLRGALALVGGPVGAITLVVGGLALMYSKMESAKEATTRLIKELDFLSKTQIEAAIKTTEAQISAELSVKKATEEALKAIISGKVAFIGATSAVTAYVKSIENSDEKLKLLNEALTQANLAFFETDEMSSGAADGISALASATEDAKDKVQEFINAQAQELAMLTMTTRQQEIYEALSKAGAEATREQQQQIVANVNALYDYNAAKEEQAKLEEIATEAVSEHIKAQEDLAKESKESMERIAKDAANAARDSEEEWRDFRNSFSNDLADLMAEGGNVFENIGNSFERMVYKMAADLLASGVMNFLSGSSIGSGTGGLSGVLKSSGTSGAITSAALNKFAPDLLSGWYMSEQNAAILNQPASAAGVNWGKVGSGALTAGAGIAGSYAGTAAGEKLFGKKAESSYGATVGALIGAMSGPLGAALGGALGGAVDALFGGDGMKRMNTGFLVGDTPGAKSEYLGQSRTFESGIKVQEFTRRGEEAVTQQIVDLFEAADSGVVQLVKDLGGALSASWVQGRGEEAGAGTTGNFFGSGSAGSDVGTQLDSYIVQLSKHITGLDDSMMQAIQSASTADGVIAALQKAIDEKAISQKGEEAKAIAKSLLDQFASSAQLLSDAEGLINGAFGAYNIAVPATRQQLYDLIKTIDPLTDSGQTALEKLTGLTGALNLFYDATEASTKASKEALAQIEKDKIQSAINMFESSISAMEEQFGDLAAAMEEIEPASKRLTDSWRENKDSLNELISSLAEAMGQLPEETAAQKLQATMESIKAIGETLGDLDEQIFSLRISKGGDSAVKLLKDRESELFSALNSSNDPSGIADKLAATGIQRINLEARIKQDAINNAAEKQLELESGIISLEKQSREIRIDSLNEEIKAAEKLQDSTRKLKDYLAELSFGSLSALNPMDQLSAAQSLFESTVSGARGGDANAMANLTGNASAYLQEAQGVFGGATSQYAAIYQAVTSALDATGGAVTDIELLQNQIEQLKSINETQSSIEQVIVDSTTEQIDYLASIRDSLTMREEDLQSKAEEQITIAKAQIDKLQEVVTGQESQIRQQAAMHQSLMDELAAHRSSLESLERNISAAESRA